MKKLNVVLAIVAIAAIVFACVFGVQKGDLQKQVDDLKASVSSLTGELDTAKKEAEEAAKKVEEAAKAAEEAAAKAAEEAAAKAAEEAAAAAKAAEEEAAKAAAEAAAKAEEEAAAAAKAAEEAAKEEEKPAEETKSDKKKVVIWSTFTDKQDEYLRKAAADFSASQDKYEVEVQTQPNQNFTSTVYNAVVNHEGPDIIFNYASEASKYVGAGLVANLDEFIYDDEMGIPDFDSLLPSYLMAEINGFEDGHIHYLPSYTSGPILFYNKTLLNELNLQVPTTWKELEEVSKAIKAAKPEVTPFGIDSKVDITQTVMLESGATYIDVAKKEVGFAGAVDAVAWLGKQIQDGLFTLTAPSGGYFSNDFNAGLVAMYYGSNAGVPYINPNGFEYDVAPAPSTKDEHAAYTIWNRGPIVFSANGEEAVEGAYLFVKYMLTTPEVAEGWAEAVLALTPWLNAQKVEGYDAYVASQPALAAVQGNFDIGVSFPSVTGASETRDAIGEMITVIGGGADAAESLAACVATCNNALQGK